MVVIVQGVVETFQTKEAPDVHPGLCKIPRLQSLSYNSVERPLLLNGQGNCVVAFDSPAGVGYFSIRARRFDWRHLGGAAASHKEGLQFMFKQLRNWCGSLFPQ